MIDHDQSRVVFMHDHRFLRDSYGRIYSEGKITDAVLARYRELANEVVIVSRLHDVSSVEGLIELDTGSVCMAPVKGLSIGPILGLHLLSNIRLVWREFASARTVVVRVPSFLSLLALPILLVQRKIYFVEVVGLPNEAVRGHGSGAIHRLIGNIMLHATRLLVRKASGAMYVTQTALQSEFPNGGLTVAASNVELPRAPLNPGMRTYNARNIPPKIGLIGSYSTSYKGIDVAVRAIAALHSQGVACALHILGSGDDAPYRKLADDLDCTHAVRFDGIRRGGIEVAEWLDGMDIYIQPSRQEGLPRALVEAMARGLPAVGSDLAGIPELLPDRWLIQVGDVNALTDRLGILLASQEERQVAGEANLLRAHNYDRGVLRERRQNFWRKAAQLMDSNAT
jgi:glycosyltransferase involved in cell wall biosynthesis